MALPGAAFFLLGTDFFATAFFAAGVVAAVTFFLPVDLLGAGAFFDPAFFAAGVVAAVTFFLPVDLLGAGAFFVAAFFVVPPDAGFAFDFTVALPQFSSCELSSMIAQVPVLASAHLNQLDARFCGFKANPFRASAL